MSRWLATRLDQHFGRCPLGVVFGVALACVMISAGCGCDLGSDWYRRSRDLKRAKQERIRELEAQGLDEAEAAAIWNQELSVKQTQGAPLLPGD